MPRLVDMPPVYDHHVLKLLPISVVIEHWKRLEQRCGTALRQRPDYGLSRGLLGLEYDRINISDSDWTDSEVTGLARNDVITSESATSDDTRGLSEKLNTTSLRGTRTGPWNANTAPYLKIKWLNPTSIRWRCGSYSVRRVLTRLTSHWQTQALSVSLSRTNTARK